MNDLIENQQTAIVAMAIVLIVLAFAYYAFRRKAAQTEAKQRIERARLRSGYVPLEVPTRRAGLSGGTSFGDLEAFPEPLTNQWEGDLTTVDETPRMRLRYLDVSGKKVEAVLQVDLLDLGKKLIVCHGDTLGDHRTIFLSQVLSARSAETGQRFNFESWIEAVRIARQRRR
jgi:NADH:ubiquinone oxidoreductase subunit 3 (subunit A)